MPEVAIKRVNFFDGQFLKQGEFLDLDLYHRHMRRRMLHLLFDQTGVVQLEADDLRVDVTNVGLKQLTVRAGLAISKRDDIVEAKEVVLQNDFLVDLNAQTPAFANGDTALLTIHYNEQLTDTSSEGGVTGSTRVTEGAVITAHRNTIPGATAPNGEPYIRLGNVDYQTMGAPTTTGRVESRIRSGLISAVSPTTPTISSITGGSGAPGTTVTAHVNGTNLTGASSITFSGTGVTGTIQPGGTATGFDVQVVINATATTGARTFTVVTPSGTAASGATVFTVSAVVVDVTSFAPTLATIQLAAPSGTLTVRGTNIRDASIANGAAAAGTVVRLVRLTDPTFVLANCTNPIALPNLGAAQQVQVNLPLRGDFVVQESPVLIQVQFGGGSDVSTQFVLFF